MTPQTEIPCPGDWGQQRLGSGTPPPNTLQYIQSYVLPGSLASVFLSVKGDLDSVTDIPLAPAQLNPARPSRKWLVEGCGHHSGYYRATSGPRDRSLDQIRSS